MGARPKLEVFHKMCCKCLEIFETRGKYAKICPHCYQTNHALKVRRKLFNCSIPLTS
jgi:hypothetical protein